MFVILNVSQDLINITGILKYACNGLEPAPGLVVG